MFEVELPIQFFLFAEDPLKKAASAVELSVKRNISKELSLFNFALVLESLLDW